MTIILPKEEENNNNEENMEINYNATEQDEECFFLMYHMNFPPSEVQKIDPDYRKWIIARFVAQKNMEREAMERNRLAAHEHHMISSKISPSVRY